MYFVTNLEIRVDQGARYYMTDLRIIVDFPHGSGLDWIFREKTRLTKRNTCDVYSLDRSAMRFSVEESKKLSITKRFFITFFLLEKPFVSPKYRFNSSTEVNERTIIGCARGTAPRVALRAQGSCGDASGKAENAVA